MIVFILFAFVYNGAMAEEKNTAIFAGGCFWCMESDFQKVDGVVSTKVGYSGGHKKDPTYEEVSAGITGHKEVLRVEFDTSKVSYKELLDIFWINIDPLDDEGQFCDRGEQYTSEIFYLNEEQKKLAEISKEEAAKKLGEDLVTKIVKASIFYPAEEYHQDYHHKNPVRYKLYRFNCRRDKRLNELWSNK